MIFTARHRRLARLRRPLPVALCVLAAAAPSAAHAKREKRSGTIGPASDRRCTNKSSDHRSGSSASRLSARGSASRDRPSSARTDAATGHTIADSSSSSTSITPVMIDATW